MFELSRGEAEMVAEKRRSLPTEFNNSIPKVRNITVEERDTDEKLVIFFVPKKMGTINNLFER